MVLPPIVFCFMLIRFSCRDDTDHCIVFSATVADNKNAKFDAHAEHDESILILRMVWIEKSHGVFIKKYGLCLFKRNTMLSEIFSALGFIPFKMKIIHMYSVCNEINKVNISNTTMTLLHQLHADYGPNPNPNPKGTTSWRAISWRDHFVGGPLRGGGSLGAGR